MSRKTLVAIGAVVIAIATTIVAEFGLAIPLTGLITFITLAAVYIKNEAAKDWFRFQAQKGKWVDPKFLTVLIGAILTALQNAGITMPISIDVINLILLAIMKLLFKKSS